MAEQILDGTTTGSRAKVGTDNRLQVRAVSEDESIHNTESGNGYMFNTGLIASISGDATLAYLKNNADNQFIIRAITIMQFEGITHSDDPYITIVRNPTGGNLISDATTSGTLVQNTNFGSSKTADVNFYSGKVSGTLTGGNNINIIQLNNPSTRTYLSDGLVNFILPKGSSMGITYTANASSGSASIACLIEGYFKDDLDIG